jgi:hypothetical protein
VQLGLRVVVSCGVVARARAVVRRDGGPEGGLRSASRPCIVWARRLFLIVLLASCGAWVDIFIFVGASRVCSSHSTYDIFSSAWLDDMGLALVVFVWALPWLYWF